MEEESVRLRTKRQKNCKRCGRIFEYNGFGRMYCDNCFRIDMEMFDKVRDYLYSYGPANAFQIELATGVDRNTVSMYLREGRLEISDDSDAYIMCERCGAKLRSGRYCPECIHKLSAETIESATFDVNEVGDYVRKKGKFHTRDSSEPKKE